MSVNLLGLWSLHATNISKVILRVTLPKHWPQVLEKEMESPENESTHPSKDTVADDNGNYSYNNKLVLKRVAQSKSSLC